MILHSWKWMKWYNQNGRVSFDFNRINNNNGCIDVTNVYCSVVIGYCSKSRDHTAAVYPVYVSYTLIISTSKNIVQWTKPNRKVIQYSLQMFASFNAVFLPNLLIKHVLFCLHVPQKHITKALKLNINVKLSSLNVFRYTYINNRTTQNNLTSISR